jgi:hypothetical protein
MIPALPEARRLLETPFTAKVNASNALRAARCARRENNRRFSSPLPAYPCIPKNARLHTADMPKTRLHNLGHEPRRDAATELETTTSCSSYSPARHSV